MPTKVRVIRERIQQDALKTFSADNPAFNNSIFTVGVVDPNKIHEPSGETLGDIAQWNEFGTGRIPARPALRRSISRMAPKLAEIGAAQAKDMLFGRIRFDNAARKLAKLLRDDMKKSITSLRTPPNAPSTIARKGFNNPLIETGFYRDSIDYLLLRTRKDGKATRARR